MSCKCKKDYNAAMALSEEPNEGSPKTNIFQKIAKILGQVVFGIIAFAVIIVMVVPFLLYVFFSLVTGKTAHVRLTRKGVKFGKKKEDSNG